VHVVLGIGDGAPCGRNLDGVNTALLVLGASLAGDGERALAGLRLDLVEALSELIVVDLRHDGDCSKR
jgi:hypothetical protein